MTRFPTLATAGVLLLLPRVSSNAADSILYTPKHEAGRCAMRDHCGSKSFFGKQLPCVDNGQAKEPDAELRSQLVELCGPKWNDGHVCCTGDQVGALKDELSTVNTIVSSCPACKENFYNMFCTFICSPDQSLFINVTNTLSKNGKTLITELDQLISEEYGTGFFDSCKNVKFGPSNSDAMKLIGGGAKNYTQFLKYLGDEKLVGSPLQINFHRESNEKNMAPLPMKPKKCNSKDQNFRCACVDCPNVCPELPMVEKSGFCKVGALPCLSFASIFVYSVLLATLVASIVGHTWYRKRAARLQEERTLLQGGIDASDEEDDEDRLVADGPMPDRPMRSYRLNTFLNALFFKLGHMAARFPAVTIVSTLITIIALSAGWVRFEIEKDPARLWVAPTSAAAQEKAFFDSQFGPFYRAEKAFLVNDTLSSGPGPVLSYETLLWWMGVEKSIMALESPIYTMRLDEVCLKPAGSACVVQSVAAYFENEPSLVTKESWRDTLRSCAQAPAECRPPYGQPLEPEMILGGYSVDDDIADAPAMSVTWVVNNFPEGSTDVARAMDWEQVLKKRLLEVQQEAKQRGLRLSFSTEISLEEELNKSTNTDAKIIVISYVIMFLYASIALGSTTLSLGDMLRNPAVSIVESKFSLGVAGILIILMSISASIGLFSWANLRATLIIVDVIPFIVLAVGVDNIFLIVHEFERVNIRNPDESVELRIAKALGRMGPSILLSAMTETVSFALGAFVGMPAVRNFAIYAAGALFINAVLQVTLFISLLSLNQKRVEDSRMDCMPCIQIKAARIQLDGSDNTLNARRYETPEEGFLQRFILRFYAPTILGRKTKVAITMLFLGMFAAGVALIPEVQLGLDQRVAMPDDSYLIPYFNDLYNYFDSGPPVYFVTKNLNATKRKHQQQICARFTTCDSLSLTNRLEQERKRTEVSYLSSPAASWIDDFFLWLNPQFEQCCAEKAKACFADRDPAWNITLSGMPEGDEFVRYLEKFLSSPTTEDCPLGGQATYSAAVVVDDSVGTIPASHFRTMHSPLRSQGDFINAYTSARRIAEEFSAQSDTEVFPYSVFYIFFDQYLSIVGLTAGLLSAAIGIIFLISSVLLGSILTGTAVALTVVMTIVDIIGAMAVFDVSLNAVSLVNLVICVGIAVEFFAHIARAFMFPSRALLQRDKHRFRGRDARAWTALVNVGGSVLSGITVTKLLGVFVLAFTRSKIFEMYYFRIWVALVVFAATHALVFLPVLLSFMGGEGYMDPDAGGGLEEDLASRRFRSIRDQDDEYSDDEG